VKKLVKYAALALLVVWAVQDPNGAAALAQALIGWFAHAARSVSTLTSHIR
jgi:hypothetical protein